jgi:predicted anti-sigma-YlaC factor YlaD
MSPPTPQQADTRSAELSCKEVARLLSDGQDRELDATERTRLKLHLAICTACRNVEQQMELIRRAMKRLGKGDGTEP